MWRRIKKGAEEYILIRRLWANVTTLKGRDSILREAFLALRIQSTPWEQSNADSGSLTSHLHPHSSAELKQRLASLTLQAVGTELATRSRRAQKWLAWPQTKLYFSLVFGLEFKVLTIRHYVAFRRFSNVWPLKYVSFPQHAFSWLDIFRRTTDTLNLLLPLSGKAAEITAIKHSLGFCYRINDQSFHIQGRSCARKQWSAGPLLLKASQQLWYQIFWGSLWFGHLIKPQQPRLRRESTGNFPLNCHSKTVFYYGFDVRNHNNI